MLFITTLGPKQNCILAALASNEYAHLQDDLEIVSLPAGKVLYESGNRLEYVYFPTTSIVSLIFSTRNGASVPFAITGNDGLLGISLVLGSETTSHRAVVQSAGAAYRLRAEIMRWELEQGGSLQQLALRYTQALMTQIAQSVVCNRHHSLEQQLCRWLLFSLDRLVGNQLTMTQELIGNMLGVRREAVTEVAQKLQAAGLISYRRGRINIIDRPGLEARVCECYAVLKADYERLFQGLPELRRPDRFRPHPATMRQRAEARWRHVAPGASRSPQDCAQLLHELEVHQVELEMHNEALQEHYEASDALRRRYADIYDFSPLGYFTLDTQGCIIDANLVGAVLLGIKGSERRRCRFGTYVEATQRPIFDGFIDEVLQGRDKKTCEIELAENKQRAKICVRIEAVADEHGRECRMVVSDISLAKAAERALREREQYQRALLDNFPFMVWLKDEKSRFLAVNEPFARSFGWPSAEALVGKSDFDITSRELAQAYRKDDRMVLRTGLQKNVIEQIESAGQRRWFETYKSPVVMDGRHIGTVGFARDITEHYKAQCAQKNATAAYLCAMDGLRQSINPEGAVVNSAEARRDPSNHGEVGTGLDAKQGAPLCVGFAQADRCTFQPFGASGLGLSINRHLGRMLGTEPGADPAQPAGLFRFTVRLGKAASRWAEYPLR